MQNVQHQKHLEKRNRNWFDTFGFAVCIFTLVILVASFRLPSSNTTGGIKLTVGNGKSNFNGDERKLVFHKKSKGGTGIESKQTKSNNRETESFDPRTGSKPFSAGEGGVDLDRLARAVSIAETSGCTRGTGTTHRNCFGIRENGAFVKFDSHAASFESFKWNWKKSYGGLPTIEDARRWTGNDRAASWLKNVIYFYENS